MSERMGHHGVRSYLEEDLVYNKVLKLLVVAVSRIYAWVLGKLAVSCAAIETCRMLKMHWSLWSHRKTQNLLSFDRVLIRLLAGVITDYCMIG